MLEVFAPSSLCVWNQMPWRNLQTRVLPYSPFILFSPLSLTYILLKLPLLFYFLFSCLLLSLIELSFVYSTFSILLSITSTLTYIVSSFCSTLSVLLSLVCTLLIDLLLFYFLSSLFFDFQSFHSPVFIILFFVSVLLSLLSCLLLSLLSCLLLSLLSCLLLLFLLSYYYTFCLVFSLASTLLSSLLQSHFLFSLVNTHELFS